MNTPVHHGRFRRGVWLAIALAMLFLLGTAVQSIATLLFRINNDVMKAATGNVWVGEIAREVAQFVGAQLLLHLAFGVLIYLLARATAVVWPSAASTFARTILGWFCLLAVAVIAYNAYWFPRTGLGAYYHNAMAVAVGPWPLGRIVYTVVAIAAAVTLIAAAIVVARNLSTPHRRRVTAAIVGIAALGFATAFAVGHRTTKHAEAVKNRPHIIMLGIDSLRLDQLKRFGGTGVTPNLDRFLANADVVRDATTPVARTFPSWAAILSGRSPNLTGARFNLAARDIIKVNPTLGDTLRRAGYRTIYSTDEVRFANIDQSYGFDQVVTPPIGAADFVIGSYNELPLVSVIANTRMGKWLFPYSHGNRGAATLFQPDTFLARLDHEVSFDNGPTLLITHLTASHWPYFISDTPFGVTEKKHRDDQPLYRLGLGVADRMFGEVVSMLERKGALENAIVVILSDHGEALALADDTMIAEGTLVKGLRAPLDVMDMGHGQSVLSPVQYQVLLGFRSFGPAAGFDASGRDLAGGATVEDIAPTLLDLVGVAGNPLAATGESFAALLRHEPGVEQVGRVGRIRYTETDLRVLPSIDGAVDEAETARQNSKFFEVVPATGRLKIRKGFVPLMLAYKQRAAFTEKLLLAALPAGPDAHQYVLVDKSTRTARLLLERPGPDEPDAQMLWDDMWQHYAGELHRPVSVTRDDWPLIDEQWRTFFTSRTPSTPSAQATPDG